MGQLVEVLALSVAEALPDGPILGCSIDWPTPGRRVAAQALEITGWVLLRDRVADEVEVALDAHVLGRAPVVQQRDDIARAFPDERRAAHSGFSVGLDASVLPAEAEIEVRACTGRRRLTIGRAALRRCWRDDLAGDDRRLVSVVVAEDDGSPPAEPTIASVAEQAYVPVELVVARPDGAAAPVTDAWSELGVRTVEISDPTGAALRNEGIRRTSGDVILFVRAGQTLRAGALERGIEILAQRSEAAAVLDAAESGDIAAAMYRRSAFEELHGFEESSGTTCDRELAQRAGAGFDLLYEEGVFVGSDGS